VACFALEQRGANWQISFRLSLMACHLKLAFRGEESLSRPYVFTVHLIVPEEDGGGLELKINESVTLWRVQTGEFGMLKAHNSKPVAQSAVLSNRRCKMTSRSRWAMAVRTCSRYWNDTIRKV
jgi:hypothetical protein